MAMRAPRGTEGERRPRGERPFPGVKPVSWPSGGLNSAALNALGSWLVVLAGLLLLPLGVGLAEGGLDDGGAFVAFGLPAGLAVAVGGVLRHRQAYGEIDRLQAMMLCGLSWIVLSLVGALPFVLRLDVSYLDALFETVSGFTTTGMTMLSGLDDMPRSITLWRAMTQWIGGLGIISMFLMLTSRGGHVAPIAGAESHKIATTRPEPSMVNTLRVLWAIYAGSTLAVAVLLWGAGNLSVFDALAHALTTLSTGGFSTHDASLAFFDSGSGARPRVVQYVVIAGMLAGGTSFLVHYRLLHRRWSALWDRAETRAWFGLIVAFVAALCLEQLVRHGALVSPDGDERGLSAAEPALRTITFQVVAIITTTGYGTESIAGPYFGAFARQLFLLMMLIGGCVGSTGGGIKVRRIVLLLKAFGRELYRLTVPFRARDQVLEDGEVVADGSIRAVAGLLVAWLALILVGGLVTALLSDHDGWTSISGMFSAVNNIGPCYLSLDELSALHPVTKCTYMVGMLAGRLELLPVAILLYPRARRAPRVA